MFFFYPIFYIITQSLYSRDFYRNLAQKGEGYGFRYLSFLSAIVICIFISSSYRVFNKIERHIHAENSTIEQNSPDLIEKIILVLKKLPVITIKDGKASIEEEQPYVIKDDSGMPLLIIDTRDTGSSISTEEESFIVIKKHYFILNKKKTLWDTHQNKIINHDTLLSSFLKIKSEIMLVIGFLTWTGLFLQNFFLAFIGYLLSKWMKISISYKTSCRLAAFSMTPVILLRLLDTLGPSFLVSRLSYGPCAFFIAVSYFYFALTSCKNNASV